MRIRLTTLVSLVLGSVLALVVAVSGFAGAPTTKSIPSDPEQGLTDQQREALHAAELQQFETHYSQWVTRLDVTTLNWSSLRHGSMMGQVLPPPQSLRDAEDRSPSIVVGSVSKITPDPQPYGTTVSFHVERAIKGGAAADINIWQSAHLEPTDDWTSAVIVDAEWAPLLLPGDRYVLFLAPSKEPGKYTVQDFTGTYRVLNGQIQGLPGNPFAESVNGLGETSLISTLTAGQ